MISLEDAAKNAALAAQEKSFNLIQGNNMEIQSKEKQFYEQLFVPDNIRLKNVIARNSQLSRTVALLPTTTRMSHRPGINIRGENLTDAEEELNEFMSNNNHVSKLPALLNSSESNSFNQSTEDGTCSIDSRLPSKRQQPAQAPNLPLIRCTPKTDGCKNHERGLRL